MDSENISTWQGLREKGKSVISFMQFSTKGVIVVFISLVLLTVLVFSRWFDDVSLMMENKDATRHYRQHSGISPTPIILSCPMNNTISENPTCGKPPRISSISPAPSPSPSPLSPSSASPSCPEFFRYIHEDLKPWKSTGITKEMVESARKHANVNFRLVIIDGRAYLERYSKAFQTRDIFTIWGILQLLNRYPGRIPDLDLMFNCDDTPAIKTSDFHSSAPPPLFRYCKDGTTLDIVFPDWSFWGWAELNIKPWDLFIEDIKNASETLKWKDREPYAFWKGNPWVAKTRQDLLRCNPSNGHDWKARIVVQDWDKEVKNGFRQSDQAKQCNYRYKIYIEGRSWSVSEKYILACDSPTLLVTTPFIDFFSRGLVPSQHYWPIRPNQKCKSIKFAVNWGNKHQEQAQGIGKRGSLFTREELSMENVYDYMLLLLIEYAKLLKYKPTLPEKASEICIESMACSASGLVKKFMLESMEKSVYEFDPCDLPPPFDKKELDKITRRNEKYLKAVQKREDSSKF